MALYGRAEYEAEITFLEEMETRSRLYLLERKITGFQFNQIRDYTEQAMVSARFRLWNTAKLLQENDKAKRNKRNDKIAMEEAKHVQEGQAP